MLCPHCHQPLPTGAFFCSLCGTHLTAAAPPPAAPPAAYLPLKAHEQRERVRRNLQPLGIAWCLWGMYRLLAGLAAEIAMRTLARQPFWLGNDGREFIPGLLSTMVPVIIATTAVLAAVALLTGFALLNRKIWGRPLAIIMAILSLIKIPLGTTLGIYTLWVLGPAASGLEYEAIALSPQGAII